ncbi:MAG: M28 family peptidase [Bacteroidota bacterium]|jgi:glutaminyl-peptide cyclotransferase
MRVDNLKLFFFVIAITIIAASCSTVENKKQETEAPFVQKSPEFNEDSCFSFLQKQVAFGPRVPGTTAHKKCGDYLSNQLKKYDLDVHIQTSPVTTYNKKTFNLYNIIGSYNPHLKNRVLLLAHWDCRPFADEDVIDTDKPIDGADDGASGVAVLLEVARQLQLKKPEIGIDIFFSDLEDYGVPNGSGESLPNSWCLGTQHWANNPHVVGYKANYGILLDMVGAKGAIFPVEGSSLFYAPAIIDKVWKNAANLGYSNYFVSAQMGRTTDDHVYVNEIAKIPCIDIVHMNPTTGTYGTHHHKHADNLEIIDQGSLKMVGQVVLETIWQ